MEQAEFMSLPSDAIYALGAVTVAAARIEQVAHDFLVDLYEHPGRRPTSQVLTAVRRRARKSLPIHAQRADSEAISAWAVTAGEVLTERHRLIHAAAFLQGKQGDPVLVHVRSRDVTPVDAEEIMELAEKGRSLAKEGGDLELALRHEPRPGVFLPNAVADERWIPTCDVRRGGQDMARPTDEELDSWWRELGPFPRLEPGQAIDSPSWFFDALAEGRVARSVYLGPRDAQE